MDNFVAVIKEREIAFNLPTEGQSAQMIRFVGAAQRAKGSDAIGPVARILDVLMAMIADPDDRDWVDEGMISGEVDLDDMLEVLKAWISEKEEGTSKPVKKAVRGRR